MKTSQFLNTIKIDNENLIILYNVLSQSLIAVSKKYFPAVNDALDKPDSCTDQKLYQILIKGGFILEDNFDEIDYIKYRYFLHLYNQNNLHLMLMPTLACNFGCVYCKQVEQKIYFSDKTIDRITKFVKKSMQTKKQLSVVWFGGEPLLCKKQIYKLSEEFINTCNTNKCTYSASLSTNGSLLDSDFVRDLDKLKIKSVQITIDGPPEWHNKLRPFSSGKPSFDIIKNNIENFVEYDNNSYLVLRINVCDDSYNSVIDLLDIFSEKIRKRTSQLYFSYINPSEAKRYKKFVSSLDTDDYWELYYKAIAKGWPALPSEICHIYDKDRFYYCPEADNINSFYIGPNGFLYKCSESFYPLDKEVVGTIDDFGNLKFTNFGDYLKFMIKSPFEKECKNCDILSMHVGGCRLLNFKGISQCVVSKDKYIERAAKFIFYKMKTKYRFSIGKSNYRVILLNELD